MHNNYICEGLAGCPKEYRSGNTKYELRDDGTSCWLDTYGRGAGECPCPGGYTNMGLYCYKWWPPNSQTCNCRSDQDRNGALCYPKCKPGYNSFGCCLCQPDGGPRIVLTAFQRDSCFNRAYDPSWNRFFKYVDDMYKKYKTEPEELFMIQTFFQAPTDASGTVKQIFSQLETQPYQIARRANTTYYVTEYFRQKGYSPNISMVDDAGPDSAELARVVKANAIKLYNLDLNNLALNRYPFVGSHDSATGYKGNNSRVNLTLQTPAVVAQSLSFIDQYRNGGIRFFDCRIDFFRSKTSQNLGLDGKRLLFQHTVPLEYVEDDKNFADLLNQAISDKEIILLSLSHSEYKSDAKTYMMNFFNTRYPNNSFCLQNKGDLKKTMQSYKDKGQYILYYCDDGAELLKDNWDSTITCL